MTLLMLIVKNGIIIDMETKRYPEVELELALSKAEGNLKFLAQADTATMTQGMAVLDALHAVQQARKEFKNVLEERRKKS